MGVPALRGILRALRLPVALSLALAAAVVQGHPCPECPEEAHTAAVEHVSPPPVLRWLGDCLPAGFPTRYDTIIKRAWQRHAGARYADRHCRFRAKLARESSLRENVCSKKDGCGIGQQIPEAAEDCQRQGGLKGTRGDVRFSAGCAAWLDARALRSQREPRSDDCRVRNTDLVYVSGPKWTWAGQRVGRRKLGLPSVCPEDGILAGMKTLLHERAYEEAAGYTPRILELERAMVPR